jgi:hypothetical protein
MLLNFLIIVDRPAEGSSPVLVGLPVYTELLDFLVGSPSPEPIIDFKVSAATQSRLRDLLEKEPSSPVGHSD